IAGRQVPTTTCSRQGLPPFAGRALLRHTRGPTLISSGPGRYSAGRRLMLRSIVSPELLRSFQARAARVAIGPSSMRGAGSKGVVNAARACLLELTLSDFATSNEAA